MKVNQINNVNFGVTAKRPAKKEHFLHNCYNEIREGTYKNCSFTIYDNYRNDKIASTLIIFYKSGSWIKSKLKYKLLGKRKTIWYYANDPKEAGNNPQI